VNSLGFLVVLGWWWKEILRACRPSWLILPAGIALLTLLTVFSQDPRNPSLYGWQSWKEYPSLLRVPFGYTADSRCGSLECMSYRPSPRDVALITERTRPGEPVAMYDLYDWTYHIAARRPPVSSFLPSSVVFTTRQLAQYRERLLGVPYLFVSSDRQGFPFGAHTLLDGWEHGGQFVEEARGDRLIALRRRTDGETKQ
jgi:hypothetical protein